MFQSDSEFSAVSTGIVSHWGVSDELLLPLPELGTPALLSGAWPASEHVFSHPASCSSQEEAPTGT